MRISRKKYWAELWSTLLQSEHEGHTYEYYGGFKRIYAYFLYRHINAFDKIYFEHYKNFRLADSVSERSLKLLYTFGIFSGILLFPLSFVSILIPGAWPILPIVVGAASLIMGLVGAFSLPLYKVIVANRHIGFIDQIGIDSRPDLNPPFVNELLDSKAYPPKFFHALSEYQFGIVQNVERDPEIAAWLKAKTTEIPKRFFTRASADKPATVSPDIASLAEAINAQRVCDDAQRTYERRDQAITAWVALRAVDEPAPTRTVAAIPAPTATERTPLLSRG